MGGPDELFWLMGLEYVSGVWVQWSAMLGDSLRVSAPRAKWRMMLSLAHLYLFLSL